MYTVHARSKICPCVPPRTPQSMVTIIFLFFFLLTVDLFDILQLTLFLRKNRTNIYILKQRSFFFWFPVTEKMEDREVLIS